ncbi:MAG: aldehyde dehydrogenase family protein [Lunatimonas sp.]|uniref:aldehyde dehydrogenase family protein n=1 Tax=Lunatimonas sp. TaxID=2060141 RepID=UPI00263A68CC|nr:aldehyde dehydrogenase family protein [Lunatimonas sp.]MCC5939634.1 aldehyde dehydrogenase family protein [Lunatimonas sp.]
MPSDNLRYTPEQLLTQQQKNALILRTETAAMRIKKLKSLKEWIRKHTDEIRKAVFADLGKPFAETDITEISVVLTEISHAIRNLPKWMKTTKVGNPIHFAGAESYIQYEPKGCALIISPWNYPFNLTIGPLISAIAAGCTVVLKPSELSPHTSELIETMVSDLFAPDEVAVFLGEAEVAKSLLALPFNHVFFTGSPRIGKEVMKAAAQHLSGITLELGGKSPVVVDASCDLEDAALKIAWAKSINCGQTCIAPDYILVNGSVYQPFLEKLAAAFNKLLNPTGKGIAKSSDYARIINTNHWTRLRTLLEDATAAGAEIVFGGEMDPSTKFFSPTVITGLETDMRIMQEEIFGPILPIISYNGLDEAILQINNTPQPLALYVFSQESYISDQISAKTSSGALVENDCAVHFGHPNLPFGGINTSGIGKAHGHFGFLAFSNEKAVLKQSGRFNPIKSLYPPFSLKKQKLINLFSRFS